MLDGHVADIGGQYQGEFFSFPTALPLTFNEPNDPDALYAEGKPFYWHFRRDPYKIY
jgi:hypothetical protein